MQAGKNRQKIDSLGLKNNVIFTGVRSDIPQIMMAMDVFVFPSFYEGAPNVVIEAQATGLPCIISDTITQEANITGLVEYLPLDLSGEVWASVSICSTNKPRRNTQEDFSRYGYDIESVTKEFVELIFGDYHE